MAAVERGERVAIYLFDEHLRAFLARSRGLGMDVDAHIASGMLHVQQLDPAEMTPGQFGHMVVNAIETRGVTMVAVDSLTGYMTAMTDERMLTIHLHELLSFLTQRGVTTLVTLAQHGPFSGDAAGADVSYIADGIILLRYFEAAGQVRQAISIIKARTRAHERTIREFTIGQGGYRVGDPLVGFQGVLTGVPQYIGTTGPLLDLPASGISAPSK
jgi:circadian clock protein KaiC